jgi:hypothetical protein
VKLPLKDPVLYDVVKVFILEVNTLKLEVVTNPLVSAVPPEPVLTVIGKVDPSPFVKVIVFKLTEAVVNNDPVLVVDPLTTYSAQLAVPLRLPVKLPLNDPVLYDAVNMFILAVNALKLEVVTNPLVSAVPPDPVLTVIGNVDPSPFVNVIVFKDTEAVVKREPVLTAAAAFSAYEAVKAYEADKGLVNCSFLIILMFMRICLLLLFRQCLLK